MMIVHRPNNSRLGLPYEVKRYERDRQAMLAPPELHALHSRGKSSPPRAGGPYDHLK